mmetsp:Transcript_272/g.444  ORF Transcript_272/g.444 Transcript_272/m.444 type:complete len:163 (+) Transcript_272:367-855(+)|eukprot:CAMPEP_0176498268 /NCGR_PEP_ID=MMETSP0200_2-20121128/12221_1 /TAXON_ID=947934 /ORGANISM="Chaetoceros sp., Strain GSL56" /LENGTH=162 /DNA_ID=CAMNT_0017896445 /DNA_START=356 /DNA_END=844 /DNA_ORIENTATION=+
MSPPKQVRAISNTKRSHEHDLKMRPCAIIKTCCENDDYDQEFKIVYDFEHDDHVALHKSHKDIPDDDDNFFDVNENEYTNAALARSCKVVTGNRIDYDGCNGIVNEETLVDTENVETQDVEEPSPFFVNEDGEYDRYEEAEFEDGDWVDENEIEYYVDDDCW